MAPATALFECHSCHQRFSRQCYSRTQLKSKGSRRRCKQCIEARQRNFQPVAMNRVCVANIARDRVRNQQKQSRRDRVNRRIEQSRSVRTNKQPNKSNNFILQQIKADLNETEFRSFNQALSELVTFKHLRSASLHQHAFKARVIEPLHTLFGATNRNQHLLKLAEYVPTQYRKYYMRTLHKLRFKQRMKSLLNQQEYPAIKQAIGEISQCQTEAQLKEKVIAPIWSLLRRFEDDPTLQQFAEIYVPSVLRKYFLREIEKHRKQYQFEKDVQRYTNDDEYRFVQQILTELSKVENEDQLKDKVIEPLLSRFPASHEFQYCCSSKLSQFLPRSLSKLYSDALKKYKQTVHTLVLDRICNALKQDDKYGIFVALAFRKLMNEAADSFGSGFVDDAEVDEDFLDQHTLCIFEDDERDREPMRDYVGFELQLISNQELERFVRKAMVNKKYKETFDDESRSIEYNPLPPKLLNKQRFEAVSMKRNHSLPQCSVQIIYAYLTGYAFIVSMPTLTECYLYDANRDETVHKLANNQKYGIRWIKRRSMCAVGKLNVIEFVCGDRRIPLGCIAQSDMARGYRAYAVVIQRMLEYYGCDSTKLETVELAWIDESEYEQVKSYCAILDECRKVIHPDIDESTGRYRKLISKGFTLSGYDTDGYDGCHGVYSPCVYGGFVCTDGYLHEMVGFL